MWGGERGSTSGAGSVPALPWGALSHRTATGWGLAPSRIRLGPRAARWSPAPFPAPPGAGRGRSRPRPARHRQPVRACAVGTSPEAGQFSRRAAEARATCEPPRAGIPAPAVRRGRAGAGVAGKKGKGCCGRGLRTRLDLGAMG